MPITDQIISGSDWPGRGMCSPLGSGREKDKPHPSPMGQDSEQSSSPGGGELLPSEGGQDADQTRKHWGLSTDENASVLWGSTTGGVGGRLRFKWYRGMKRDGPGSQQPGEGSRNTLGFSRSSSPKLITSLDPSPGQSWVQQVPSLRAETSEKVGPA